MGHIAMLSYGYLFVKTSRFSQRLSGRKTASSDSLWGHQTSDSHDHVEPLLWSDSVTLQNKIYLSRHGVAFKLSFNHIEILLGNKFLG